MNRRGALELAARAAGGLPRPRPDQLAPGTRAGIQPGTQSGIFRGRLVVIFGTGPGSGLFVYAGNPGPGNPPVLAGVAPGVTKDPYGNSLLTVADPNAVLIIGQSGGNQIVADGSTGRLGSVNNASNIQAFLSAGQLIFPAVTAPGNQPPSVQGGGNSAGENLTLSSGKGTAGATAAQFQLEDSLLDPQGLGQIIMIGRLVESLAGAIPAPLIDLTAPAAGPIVRVTNLTATPNNAALVVVPNAAGDRAIGVLVGGDTNNRLLIDSNGKHSWGPGNAAQDTTLYRAAAGIVGTDGAVALTDSAGPAGGAAQSQLYSGTGRLRETAPSGLDTALSGARGNATTTTVTQAVFTALTALATIPANDAAAGTTYLVEAEGSGTWGATQQQLTMAGDLDGGQLAATNVLSTAFAVSAAVQWQARLKVRVLTTGALGTVSVVLWVHISPGGNHGLADSVEITRVVDSAAFNTTIAHTLGIGALWAAVVGAPTIHSNGSDFLRRGQ